MDTQQAFALALQHHQAGRLRDAEMLYRQVLAIQPNHELRPNYPEAWNNLGLAWATQGRFEEAITAYRQALQLRPDYPEAHSNLGLVLREGGQLDQAIAEYREALKLRPDSTEAWNNLGNALAERGQFDESVVAYRQALRLKPAYAEAHSNLIFTLHYHPNENHRMTAEEHQRWNQQFGEPLKGLAAAHANDRRPLRRLKIGYVSSDFCSHPVAFFLAPLLEAHDHGSFEIYGHASVHRPDAITERMRKSADVWRDVRACTDAQLAERIRSDGIDILVDLAMHTAGNRLLAFAHRPSPVQVSWLAYPGSTGMEAIDYRLTDAHIDPPGQDHDGPGGEAMCLPDSWCSYAPIKEFPLVAALPAAKTGWVTFASLNQFSKLHESLLHCWAGLLETLPDSRLLIVCPEGEAKERTYALFAARGIARERLELATPCPWADYIRLFERIDIALDAYPCNGMTTTCHTLWMGVPVVTRAGTSAVSHAGSSLLHAVGLPEWIAQTEEEYLRIATEWAADLPRLAELRRTLRPRMRASPLMDAPRFARHIEAAYRTMWRRWCAEKQS